jgi:hypothetical protein
LDWQPRVGLEAGLTRTIAYFDELLARASEVPGAGAASAPEFATEGV